MPLPRRLLKNIDYTMIVAVLLLLGLGLLAIASATQANAVGNGGTVTYVKKQALGIIIGLVAAVVVMSIDYSNYSRFANYLYFGSLAMLLLVLLPGLGKENFGAQRWFSIGSFEFQPSEFAKLAIIITFADLLSKKNGKIETWQELLPLLVHVGIPLLLILRQPDLGTTLIILAAAFAMLYVSGLKAKFLNTILGAGLAISPVLWHLLKPYQKRRLLVFINPQADPLGDGYHIIQSKIAIGSGQLFGKGLFAGTQNQLKFLPIRHTDFIFSVIGEEFGFIGSIVLLALLWVFLWRGTRVVMEAKDTFGSLIAVGIVAAMGFQSFINIGMTMGIMPVTGKTLPFVSYGGTSIVANLLALGVLLSVYIRRQKIMF
ncbi:MAG: rod shape-determining protein RodA [bacterium]|jgi:rod shape determining protein RodA